MGRIAAVDRRARLAEAALAVAARDGLAAASTRAIVGEAGMPLASFHYAVPSRDDLLRDVVELVVEQEGEAAGAFLGDAADVRGAVRDALGGYLAHVRRDPGREQAMFELTQHALRTPGLDDLPAEQYARYHAVAAGLLGAGAARLGIRWTAPVADLARLLVMMTDGATLAWLADRDDAAAERALDLAADAIAAFAVSTGTTIGGTP
jgi:AcrR family transcriptional regulator